jgi:hypothetical protein
MCRTGSQVQISVDRKHPIQIVRHRPAAALLHRQSRLGAVERLDLMGWMAPSLHRRAMLVAVERHPSGELI